MPIRYLFLDDEDPVRVKPYVDALTQRSKHLKIILRYPVSFSEEIKRLMREDYDGLILDLRLDQVSRPDQKKVDYRAATLAQEIRTRGTETGKKEIPIVLCSAGRKLNRSFRKDDTSHDLFDGVYVKEDVVNEADRIALELLTLATGYRQILEIRSKKRGKGSQVHKFVGLDEEKKNILDPRIYSYFELKEGLIPAHEYARFIMKALIKSPGPLVDERVLAARLGIDYEASYDWETLKTRSLRRFAYQGPFSEAWPRWWFHLVEDWWNSHTNSPGSLSALSAGDRVQFLRKVAKLERLIPAEPIRPDYSHYYWTICKALGRPLDPVDGFIIDRRDAYPWQEQEYISKIAALERIDHDEGLRVHPLERDRLKELKSVMSKNAKD
jgi:hypothetical protein